jgi:hypothetical protein
VADRCRVVAGSLFEEVPTGGEYAALFREAGFELVRVTPSESGLQVLEGVPA